MLIAILATFDARFKRNNGIVFLRQEPLQGERILRNEFLEKSRTQCFGSGLKLAGCPEKICKENPCHPERSIAMSLINRNAQSRDLLCVRAAATTPSVSAAPSNLSPASKCSTSACHSTAKQTAATRRRTGLSPVR